MFVRYSFKVDAKRASGDISPEALMAVRNAVNLVVSAVLEERLKLSGMSGAEGKLHLGKVTPNE